MRNVLRLPHWLHKRITETSQLYTVSKSDIIAVILEAFFANAKSEQIEYVINMIRQKQIADDIAAEGSIHSED